MLDFSITQLAADFISMRNQHADLQRYKCELEARLTEAERQEEEEAAEAAQQQQPTQDEVEKFVRLQSEKVSSLFHNGQFLHNVLKIHGPACRKRLQYLRGWAKLTFPSCENVLLGRSGKQLP